MQKLLPIDSLLDSKMPKKSLINSLSRSWKCPTHYCNMLIKKNNVSLSRLKAKICNVTWSKWWKCEGNFSLLSLFSMIAEINNIYTYCVIEFCTLFSSRVIPGGGSFWNANSSFCNRFYKEIVWNIWNTK